MPHAAPKNACFGLLELYDARVEATYKLSQQFYINYYRFTASAMLLMRCKRNANDIKSEPTAKLYTLKKISNDGKKRGA